MTTDAIEGVNVITEQQTGTLSDARGEFSILLREGSQELHFSRIGFKTTTIKVTVPTDEMLIIELIPKSEILGSTVISAGRYEQDISEVTVSMEVIPADKIVKRNFHSVDELVNESSGISVIDGQANIRGGSGYSYGAGSRVLLLVDEIPMLTADAGDVKWDFLPAENLSQVEIIKGASSALYGSSAMNGIIHFRTAYPGSESQSSVSISNGVYDSPSSSQSKWWSSSTRLISEVSAGHRQKFGRLDFVTGINYFKDDGYRMGEHQERYRVNVNTRYRDAKVEGLNYGVNVNTMKREGGTFFIWENDTNGVLIPLGGLDPETTSISNYSLYRTSIDPFIVYGSKKSRHQLRGRFFRANNENDTGQGSLADTYYLQYSYQRKFGERVMITTGMAELYQQVKSDLYEDHIANNISGFVQAEFDLNKVHLSLGLRSENQRIDDIKYKTASVIRSGLSYSPFKSTVLRTSFGQAYRFPTIAEKFVNTQVGDFFIYPNNELEPESGWSAELGIRQMFRAKNLSGFLDIAAFWSEYNDMMEFVFGFYGPPLPPFFGAGFRSENVGNTRIRGFELSANIQGDCGKIQWQFYGGYTFIDPISKDFNAALDTLRNSANYNILKYRYEHLARLALTLNYSIFEYGISMRYNSFMENIDAVFESQISGVERFRERNNSGDHVFDTYLKANATEELSFSFVVKNLLNREYMGRPADIQPPRIFELQVRLVI